ncbi:fimbrial protein [Salmonella enterica]|uniref:F4 family fimbrial subunit n=1 Tax=Salmonella enterica TaxID=28901 RepID=UPI0009ADA2F3|nr:fimbrial protein [Salmonella enterica]EBO5291389.1 fimbrial protein [Salmonella enterica subsp. enterica serovar Typhimurium]ECF7040451.1 fimbrial protein [Salmonella enterica subsp. enterica]EEJ3916315.1 fimbrial protein [Salmonella enterica subsp. enterica serovar Waral]EBD0851822.1 fimbrial protein [Salmonella enterica]EBF2433899.1 fimbrial protein [Salmonella enterica]
MKKTLIALAVVASATSGLAHAWTNGNFNGTVNVGGNITAGNNNQNWAWAVGDGLDSFANVLADLTSGGTKLTITVNDNKPILKGKTVQAYTTTPTGPAAAVPNIAFTDYEGTSVALTNPDGESNSGKAFLILPMKSADGTKIGSVKVNASYAGVFATGYPAGQTNVGTVYSLWANNSGHLFNGGLPTNVGGSELKSGTTAAQRTALFGSLSMDDMLQQIKALNSNITSLASRDNYSDSSNGQANNGVAASAAYVLGIAAGQTIEATFDQAVTAATQWAAPLNIAVSYN